MVVPRRLSPARRPAVHPGRPGSARPSVAGIIGTGENRCMKSVTTASPASAANPLAPPPPGDHYSQPGLPGLARGPPCKTSSSPSRTSSSRRIHGTFWFVRSLVAARQGAPRLGRGTAGVPRTGAPAGVARGRARRPARPEPLPAVRPGSRSGCCASSRPAAYMMASWHLFMQGRLQRWLMRAGRGVQRLPRGHGPRGPADAATQYLAEGRRPLVIFPEGVVTRGQRPARRPDGRRRRSSPASAAKHRAKAEPPGQVVIHPVALHYDFGGDLRAAGRAGVDDDREAAGLAAAARLRWCRGSSSSARRCCRAGGRVFRPAATGRRSANGCRG